MTIQELLASIGFPALCFWLIQRSITKRDAQSEKREDARKKNEYLLIKGMSAAIALAEATAESVRRLDGKCNGKMSTALEYAQKVRDEQSDFLQSQGIENLY